MCARVCVCMRVCVYVCVCVCVYGRAWVQKLEPDIVILK